jgi:hypothetical protein
VLMILASIISGQPFAFDTEDLRLGSE